MSVEVEEDRLDEVDIEEESARLVEAEEKLRESMNGVEETNEPGVSSTTIVLDPSELLTRESRQIIGGGRNGDEFEFKIKDRDEVTSLTVPWPDDPRDPREPLVRLARGNGTEVERIADMDSVPVARTDKDSLAIIVPPTQQYRDVEFVLPGDRRVTQRVPVLSNIVSRVAHPFAKTLMRTPLVPIKEENKYRGRKVKAIGNRVAALGFMFGFIGVTSGIVLDGSMVGLSLVAVGTFLMIILITFAAWMEQHYF